MNELLRRNQEGTLSIQSVNQLVERALKEQIAATPGPLAAELLDFARLQFRAGRLSEQQRLTFFRQMAQLSLRIREKIVLGDPIPYQIEQSARTPGGWYVCIFDGAVSVDGVRVRDGGGGFSSMSGIGAGGSSGGSVLCDRAGEHRLEVNCRVSVTDLPPGSAKRATTLFEEVRTFTGQFTVLPEAPADYIKLIESPTLGQQIQAAISPREFYFGISSTMGLEGAIAIKNCPVNVAFEVFARCAGKEYRLNSIAATRAAAQSTPSASRCR
jgi:hypothetical protein